jgi:hypothetical protein
MSTGSSTAREAADGEREQVILGVMRADFDRFPLFIRVFVSYEHDIQPWNGNETRQNSLL